MGVGVGVGVGWWLDAPETIAQTEVPEESVIHAGGVTAEAEEDEDHEA